MIVKYDPDFLAKLKKSDVRIRKSFKKRLEIFILKRNFLGYRSIDITNDWRAVFAEKHNDKDVIVYFIEIGTHEQLYKVN